MTLMVKRFVALYFALRLGDLILVYNVHIQNKLL